MSNSAACAFINAIILGHLISDGLYVNLREGSQGDALFSYGYFVIGGFCASVMNVLVDEWPDNQSLKTIRALLVYVSFTLWITGVAYIGFVPDAFPSLESLSSSAFLVVYVHVCGGFFYHLTQTQAMDALRANPSQMQLLLLHVISMPVIVILLTACFLSVLDPSTEYLIGFRLIVLIAAPLYVFQLISFNTFNPFVVVSETNTKKTKSESGQALLAESRMVDSNVSDETTTWSWLTLVLSVVSCGLFHTIYFVPIVVIPDSVTDIYLLMGGMLAGKFFCGCFIVLISRETSANDVNSWKYISLLMVMMSALVMMSSMLGWAYDHHTPTDLHLELVVFFYGLGAGYMETWMTFQIMWKTIWQDMKPSMYTMIMTAASVPGPFLIWFGLYNSSVIAFGVSAGFCVTVFLTILSQL